MEKVCDTCGNKYEKSFKITAHSGEEYFFDSFECAIKELAPHCQHCDCAIIGHGVEVEGRMFCCQSCSRHDPRVMTREEDLSQSALS